MSGDAADDGSRDLPGGEPESSEETFKIHYIKSNHFRVIHVDGMIGGLAPSADGIEMALFSERLPIPKSTLNKFIDDDGTYEELSTLGREGITREVDINAIMSVETAEKIGRWLLEQVLSWRKTKEEEDVEHDEV